MLSIYSRYGEKTMFLELFYCLVLVGMVSGSFD